MTYNEIINEFEKHLSKSGRRYYNEFYVGVTNDPERRMFMEHRVSKDKQWYICLTADTSNIAREVEKHYLDLGMRGAAGGGDDSARYIYAYTIEQYTVE